MNQHQTILWIESHGYRVHLPTPHAAFWEIVKVGSCEVVCQAATLTGLVGQFKELVSHAA